jgi:hypothetical protein
MTGDAPTDTINVEDVGHGLWSRCMLDQHILDVQVRVHGAELTHVANECPHSLPHASVIYPDRLFAEKRTQIHRVGDLARQDVRASEARDDAV